MKILNRYTSAVIFESPCSTMRETVIKAVLENVNLSGSNLSGSNLSGSDLSGSNLSYSNLSYSNLSYSNLSGSNLSYSNLSYSNLSYSNLSGSDLSYSDLSYSDLSGAKNEELAIARTRIVAQGSIIGWKKAGDGTIIKLRIPEEARRSHAFGRKCRAEFADVLEMFGPGESTGIARSDWDRAFEYKVGERATPSGWCEDWQQECEAGIHFYITREEAEAH